MLPDVSGHTPVRGVRYGFGQEAVRMWWVVAAMANPTRFLVPHAPAAEGAVVPLDGGVLVIGEGGSWFCGDGGCARREPLPFPRHDFAVAIDPSGDVWVVGGWSVSDAGLVPSDLVHRYDAARDVWVSVSPMPDAIDRPLAAFAASGELQVRTRKPVAAVAVRNTAGRWSRELPSAVVQPAYSPDAVGVFGMRGVHWEAAAPTVDDCAPSSPEIRVHALDDTVSWSRPTPDGRVELLVGVASDFCEASAPLP